MDADASPDASSCYVCRSRPADAAHPIVVWLKKTLGQSGTTLHYKMQEVRVPACAECSRREGGRERRANGVLLAFMLLPIAAGAVWMGGEGALLGLGVGFFGSLVLRAFLSGRSVACKHPSVTALEGDGWHYEHMFDA